MEIKESIINILNPLIKDTEVYIVDIVVSSSKIRKKISIFLDTDEGIKIDECSDISRNLAESLDELIDTAFILEVSSPGADAPIILERQYKKHIGRTLKIINLNDEEIIGELKSIEGNKLTVQPNNKKKTVFDPLDITIDNIKEAKVVISFK